MREFEITKYSVRVKVSVDELLRLDDEPEIYLDIVMPRLRKQGAEDIEYSGHFGANVFFDVERQEDIPNVIAELEKILKEI